MILDNSIDHKSRLDQEMVTNGLVTNGTKPLPDLILTQIRDVTSPQWVLWKFTQNFEPTHKICILRGGKNLMTYDMLELWHLKSSWDGPQVSW